MSDGGGRICEKGQRGIVFPIFGDAEQAWPTALRVVLYMVGLFWTFAGVAIIADVFMAAIEKVTAKKLRLWDKQKQRFYTFELWNATVSNLTLMALGSSAPEILLNVIDIIANDFFLEGLGPGTIVGSAAFNLLMIIAVCIVSIPNGQIRCIKDVRVYAVTASWSIFAYLWLLFILVVTSPNVVEPWEGVVTFLLFPAVVFQAWSADKGYLGGPQKKMRQPRDDMLPEELADCEAQIRREHGDHLSNEQVGKLMIYLSEKPTTRAAYRVAATRQLFGGKRIQFAAEASAAARQTVSAKFSFIVRASRMKVIPVTSILAEEPAAPEPPPVCTFSFPNGSYACFENAGKIKLSVWRHGDISMPARVWYQSKDGTAKAAEDYQAVRGWLNFAAGQAESHIQVDIVDDQAYEDDEDFYVQLSKPEIVCDDAEDGKLRATACSDSRTKKKAGLGKNPEVVVTIIDDDDAGTLSFEADTLTLTPGNTKDMPVNVKVRRIGGGCGDVSAQYRFEGDTAVKDRDFEGEDGTVHFPSGEMEDVITVTLKAVPRYDRVDRFRIVLTNPTHGAKLDPNKDGGSEKNILTVLISPEAGTKDRIDKWRNDIKVKWQKSQVGYANWAAQFKAAFFVNGGDEDDEDDDPPSKWDYIGHVLTCPWKFLFAFVPPVDYCGGWLCFFCSLLMIGFVTMLINDMASLLGCCLCMPDELTAITFVALGTSLPDTFASMTAAVQDHHADASVGNVTGSNCVNVFLGLGLPWMVASVKWAISGPTAEWTRRYAYADDLDWLGPAGSGRQIGFVVMAGTLGYSVAVFSVCAILCICLLALRRHFLGGELGGPRFFKYISAGCLVLLWVMYVALSALKSFEDSDVSCPR